MASESAHELLFELMHSGGEALEYLHEELGQHTKDTCVVVSQALLELYENIAEYVESHKINEQHRALEASLNAALAAEKLNKSCSISDFEQAHFLLTYALIPLHVFLSNELHTWYAIYPSMERMHDNRDRQLKVIQEYKQHHENALKAEYAYDVSIMVLCYNKVYLTKIAVESLLKYTDFEKYKVEIIVINNGSDDNGETAAYISELNDPRIKTIDLKYPLGYNAQSLGPAASRGRYFVEFHSDVVATKNWLNNLMDCICSDTSIGAAVAVCNESSNYQTIDAKYSDPIKNDTEMQRFASKHNHSDPQLWEDRFRIIPISGYITPTMLYRQILRDPWLYYGQFTDDDMSVFLRRSGFRQVLARDTFLHHFGSQTSSADIDKNDSVRLMGKRFYQKWDLDAWHSSEFNPAIVHYMMHNDISGLESFLFIDPLFGSTPMCLYNKFREEGKTIGGTTAIVSDKRYAADAEHYYDEVITGGVVKSLEQLQSKFDYIIFHPSIEDYIDRDFPQLLSALHPLCKAGTKVLFTLKNPAYYMRLFELAGGVVSTVYNEPWRGVRLIEPQYLLETVNQHGFKCTASKVPAPQNEQHKQIIQNLRALVHGGKNAESLTCIMVFFEMSPK